MRAIVTGMTGTVAPALARALRGSGWEVVAWDRARVATDDDGAVRGFIERERPDWVCHIATGAPEWAERIARSCAAMGVRLLWAGSVSVFSERNQAPLTVEMAPDATDDYGRYKIECEARVRQANPGALVARLGWQIGDGPGSNTMLDYFHRRADAGNVRFGASRGWVASCAMLEDTAHAMAELMTRGERGVLHLEGNEAGMSLFEIASALAPEHGWEVSADEEPVRDNRMHDPRVRMAQVAERLGRGARGRAVTR
ncbi:MAG TPA: epimerase [Phycisphaerales bacterium]|nr:epimerase [Phycisphaerales bacterium]